MINNLLNNIRIIIFGCNQSIYDYMQVVVIL